MGLVYTLGLNDFDYGSGNVVGWIEYSGNYLFVSAEGATSRDLLPISENPAPCAPTKQKKLQGDTGTQQGYIAGSHNFEGWVVFERNGRSAAIPDAQLGDNIPGPMRRTGSQRFP